MHHATHHHANGEVLGSGRVARRPFAAGDGCAQQERIGLGPGGDFIARGQELVENRLLQVVEHRSRVGWTFHGLVKVFASDVKARRLQVNPLLIGLLDLKRWLDPVLALGPLRILGQAAVVIQKAGVPCFRGRHGGATGHADKKYRCKQAGEAHH
ncbi:hypothetical protein D3C78_1362980 [compost metagenome]